MARVYFVREEISVEVPVETSVLEVEILAGLAPDAPCGGAGNLWKMSGEGGWKACAGVSDESGKGLSGGDSWEEKRGKILSEGFSRKVNFQPELQVKTVWLEKPETGEKSQSGK